MHTGEAISTPSIFTSAELYVIRCDIFNANRMEGCRDERTRDSSEAFSNSDAYKRRERLRTLMIEVRGHLLVLQSGRTRDLRGRCSPYRAKTATLKMDLVCYVYSRKRNYAQRRQTSPQKRTPTRGCVRDPTARTPKRPIPHPFQS